MHLTHIQTHTHTYTRSTWPFRLKSLQVNSACYQKEKKKELSKKNNSTDQRSKNNDITKRNQKENFTKNKVNQLIMP